MTARDPEECNRLFGAYVNAGDLDGVLSLYEPECRLVRRDGTVATGHAEIREELGRLVALRPVVRRQPDGSWRVAIDDPFARG